MLAFRVEVDGEEIAVSGVADWAVLAMHVTRISQQSVGPRTFSCFRWRIGPAGTCARASSFQVEGAGSKSRLSGCGNYSRDRFTHGTRQALSI